MMLKKAESIDDPDAFRLRYRNQIGEFVRAVVTGSMGKREASRWIAERTRELIDETDQARFQEVVETEPSGLHEGNIARYRLRLSEFQAWEVGWKSTMPKPGEHKTVQARILAYAQEVGWTFVPREEARKETLGLFTRLLPKSVGHEHSYFMI